MAPNEPRMPAKTATARSVADFLAKVAAIPAPASGARGRLVFALDATASREATWDHACQIQGEMFRESAALGGIEVQLVYFRGFGDFQATAWLDRSDGLIAPMAAVRCLGGQTQIDKVLRHAIAETRRKRVNALVFVGDCVEENVDDLAVRAGELGLLGVPAFLFQEATDPVASFAFQQISRLTRGAYCRFDASSAQQLRELLSAVAVYAAGGRRALDDFSRRSGNDAKFLTSQMK